MLINSTILQIDLYYKNFSQQLKKIPYLIYTTFKFSFFYIKKKYLFFNLMAIWRIILNTSKIELKKKK